MPSLDQLVREFIVDRFLFGQGGDLGDEDSLLERGAIDSTGVLELVAHLERSFGIQVDEMELVPENLDTIGRIARFVERKRAAGGASEGASGGGGGA